MHVPRGGVGRGKWDEEGLGLGLGFGSLVPLGKSWWRGKSWSYTRGVFVDSTDSAFTRFRSLFLSSSQSASLVKSGNRLAVLEFISSSPTGHAHPFADGLKLWAQANSRTTRQSANHRITRLNSLPIAESPS